MKFRPTFCSQCTRPFAWYDKYIVVKRWQEKYKKSEFRNFVSRPLKEAWCFHCLFDSETRHG